MVVITTVWINFKIKDDPDLRTILDNTSQLWVWSVI